MTSPLFYEKKNNLDNFYELSLMKILNNLRGKNMN